MSPTSSNGSGTSPDPAPRPDPSASDAVRESGRAPVDRGARARRAALQAAGAFAVLALIVWVNLYAAEHDLVHAGARRFGYAGILAAAAVSGFNLVVPVPVIAFYPFFMEVGFAPVVTVLVIAAGMTLGDLVGYVLGHAAREVMAPRRRGLVGRLERLRERHPVLPFVVMFLYAAFAPIPNEVLVIPLAFLRYPVTGIFLAVLTGNVIFNSLVALGVVHVFEAL